MDDDLKALFEERRRKMQRQAPAQQQQKKQPVGSVSDPICLDDDDDDEPTGGAAVVTNGNASKEGTKRSRSWNEEDSMESNKKMSAKPSSNQNGNADRRRPRAETNRDSKIHHQVPIKLLTTRLDEENRRQDSALYRSTHATLRQLLGFDGVEQRPMQWLVACNYLVDFDFIMDLVPELLSCPLTVFFYGSGHSSPEPWKRACTQPNGTCSAHFVKLKPSDDPQSATNPLRYKFRYGVHHTKMFLIGYLDGIRVVIFTGNLVPGDTHYKAQGAYVQDFPLKQAGSKSKGTCQFEKDLVSYVRTYQYQTNHKWDGVHAAMLTDELVRYDYSSAKVVLIPSTPGYHKIEKAEVGLLKLQKTIEEHATSSGASRPIVCQFSSMGSLSQKWLAEQFLPATSLVDAETANSSPLSEQLKLVYPTVEEIRTSVEGYFGGGSVPGGMKNVRKPLLQPLLCKWTSSPYTNNPFQMPRNVPHIKSFYQLGDDNASMNWFLLTSHNMSTTAFGQKQKSKFGGQVFFVQHWELGVFVSPKLLGAGPEGRLVPFGANNDDDENSIPIPLPYSLVPEHYGPNDEPWAWDATYSIPDAYGRFGVSVC